MTPSPANTFLLIPPWTDRAGRFSPLKFVVFLAVLAPAAWIVVEARHGWLGSRPVTEAIHQSGLWAIRLLAATLAVTPLRRASRWSKLISVRRILGVSALAYAALHLGLYGLDQHFDLVQIGSEIARRIYLTIGFAAFCGLCALGATSTDGMIARLGGTAWGRLQQLVYPIAIVATVHFFIQSKLDVSEPIIMGGLFALLFGFRIADRRFGDLSLFGLIGLAFVSALATAVGEAFWYAVSIRAPLAIVLAANFDFSYAVRPCWFVLGGGAILCAARLMRPIWAVSGGGSPATRRRMASVRPEIS
ncbi:sulfite oxidase heme-binding subunit YedZ [Methylocapsa acidiphila]|uniref:sulfite oxidase heme-binding subunit YedZ n=1 Tax=Methylocapsa acidiphila TaxID=133552 RepID=UPI0004250C6F|nr:protein-methionine-sulfoxide reductase heme-binding subunit MsrQ [Methylocapsa acidiphila]